MLRIVAGRARGRRLVTPAGDRVRPTSDRVREAVFSALTSRLAAGFSGLRVLDAFAGTGALGLEAWSRGAAHVTFFERDRKALACLDANIAALGVLAGECEVDRVDALAAFNRPRAAFDVVFVDPPYDAGLYAPALETLAQGARLRPGAIVVVEHRTGATVTAPASLELDFDRAWGDTTVKLMTYSSESAS